MIPLCCVTSCLPFKDMMRSYIYRIFDYAIVVIIVNPLHCGVGVNLAYFNSHVRHLHDAQPLNHHQRAIEKWCINLYAFKIAFINKTGELNRFFCRMTGKGNSCAFLLCRSRCICDVVVLYFLNLAAPPTSS